ncbi:MAG TPA: DUF47 family protein [Verrucomicrobiae bacterium]|jgi:uncharacterized protein Yka (UPF0111/DUF47 family)|nr:DUF47 family protein [Verrucomicrobiae bacterium]
MFSLQKLLGQEDKFFNLLEASAQEARTSVDALVKLIAKPDQSTLSYEFVESRRKEKELRGQISEAVYTTFVTALEREDIESLANALYKIPKTVEKFGARLLLTPQHVQGVDFTKQINLLADATATVQEMVQGLRQGLKLEEVRRLNDKMQYLEGEADKEMMELLRNLFSGKHEPITVIVRKDLYELLEKIIDRCRDVGNVISNIALKNS